MSARILFFVSYHALCLQPFPSFQGSFIRYFYSSPSRKLILVVWTAGQHMHFLFCLRMSQKLRKWREGKKLFCHIKTRASSMSHVRFLQSVGYSGVDLSASLSHLVTWFCMLKSVWKQKLYSRASWATWQDGVLGWPFCLDLSRNCLVASDPDYFISARSHCHQYRSLSRCKCASQCQIHDFFNFLTPGGVS